MTFVNCSPYIVIPSNIDKLAYYKQRFYFRLTLFATLLAFFVVILGAYTRLTDSGLGCPDWPACYGHLAITKSVLNANPIINAAKAWTEMIHRYMAGLLGMVIFALAILAIRNIRHPEQPVALPLTLVVMVIFQAMLGMWTVTLKLFPLVVLAHLIGGLTTLTLLWWLVLKLKPVQLDFVPTPGNSLRIWAFIGLAALIVQLCLGGWTSANYAALVCHDFPFCQGKIFPPLDFSHAFNAFSTGVVGSDGMPLSHSGKVTIHMMHRIGAIVTALVIGWIAFQVFARTECFPIRILSVVIAVLLTIQIALGITNVLYTLPLYVAVAHLAVAALLLLSLVTLNYYLQSNPRRRSL